MKVKGVNAFEQHVEKIVLAAVSAIFLMVVALQLLTEPNRVQVGKRSEKVPPGEAFRIVEAEASKVQSFMDRVNVEELLPAAPSVDIASQFRQRREMPVAPGGAAIALGEPVGFGGQIAPVQSGQGDAPIAVVSVPPPAAPLAQAYRGTLDPLEPERTEALRPLLPRTQPYDKAWASVEATIDGTALFKALDTDPDGTSGPTRALPTNWWRGNVEVLGVRLQREERTGTGEWTNTTDVAPAPGQIDLLTEIGKDVRNQADLTYYLGEARRLAEDVARPEFYALIAGPEWSQPTVAIKQAAIASNPEIDRLLKQREERQATLDDARSELSRLPADPGTGPGRLQPAPGNTEGDIIGQPAPRARPGEDPVRRRRQLQTQIQNLETQIDRLNKQLAQEGYEEPAGATSATVAGRPAPAPRPRPLLENPAVTLWAHDLTVEPGKTYRYRMTVAINNPVYGRGASLIEAQQDLARSPVLVSEPSEWSAPVEIPADRYYFMISASEGQLGEDQRATAEVYGFYYGFYRKGTISLSPGDPIMADLRLPHPNLLPIWDVQKVLAEQAGPGQPGLAPAPPSGVPVPVPPGGDPDTILVPGPGDRGFPPPPPPPAGEAGQGRPGEPPIPALPRHAVPGPKSIPAELDAYVLDVARSPVVVGTGISTGASKTQFEVFVREPSGQIVVRVPDEDRVSQLYRIAAASAKLGETQGAPVTPAEAPRPTVERKKRERSGDDGGGGGGGG